MTTEQVKVIVSADAKPYERAMDKAAASTTKVDKAADQMTRKTKQNAIAWAAVGTAVTVASAKMLAEMNKAVQAASDLNESTTKMRVIFGGAADEIADFAKGAADAMGMSERAALDAASTMATFGKAAGLTGGDLATFSKEMVTLSGDLASFYNTSPEDAALALGAALRGEAEPARRFGILLDDLTLRNKALEMGLISTTKNALTPAQKALAAQASIMQQTRDAQGDFARTSDGLANSQRQMSAAIEDARAAFGEALLPVMTMGVQVVTALADVLAGLPAPLRNTVAGLGLLTATVGLLTPALIGASLAMDKFAASEARAAAASVPLVAALGRVGAAVKAALAGVSVAAGITTAAVTALMLGLNEWGQAIRSDKQNALADQFQEAAKQGRTLFETMQDLEQQRARTNITTNSSTSYNTTSSAGASMASVWAGLDKALSEMNPETAAVRFDELVASMEAAGRSTEGIMQQLPLYAAALGGATDAASAQAAAEEQRKTAIDEANQAIADAVTGMTGYINAMVSATLSSDNLLGAGERLKSGMASTTVAGKTASAAASAANAKAIKELRERDQAEVDAEIKAARRRAQRRADERADAQARKDVQKGIADAIATDKAARAGKDLKDPSQTSSVGEASGTLNKSERKSLDAEIERIRARHKKSLDAQIKGYESTAKAAGAASDAVIIYNNTLNASTEAGRQNRASIGGEILSITADAEKVYDTTLLMTGSAEQAGQAAYDALIESRDGLIAMAEQAGYAKKDVKAFFDEVKFTEKVIRLKFDMAGIDSATAKVDTLSKKLGTLNKLKANPKILLDEPKLPTTYTAPRSARAYADGGEVFGPGGPRADKVPVWASAGEFVVNAPQYQANRDLVKAINNGTGRVASGGMSIGQITVHESGTRVRQGVLDALAESAYRSGAVR